MRFFSPCFCPDDSSRLAFLLPYIPPFRGRFFKKTPATETRSLFRIFRSRGGRCLNTACFFEKEIFFHPDCTVGRRIALRQSQSSRRLRFPRAKTRKRKLHCRWRISLRPKDYFIITIITLCFAKVKRYRIPITLFLPFLFFSVLPELFNIRERI